MIEPPSIECVWPLQASLGEGPAWDQRTNCLWFVDIKQGRLHRYDPVGGTRNTVTLGGTPSFAVPAEGGGLLIGNGHDLLSWQDGTSRHLARVAMSPSDRLNDAGVGPDGRVWFGSMDDGESRPSGRVYVFEHGAVREVGGAAVITNGPAISPDGRWLYHVDTLAGTIWRFDLNAGDSLDVCVAFVRIEPGAGKPDGVSIDAEGYVWVGLWGGWAVRRYAPSGRLDREVRVPCANVTKLAFGGPDLCTAFVTTARAGLDEAALARQPLAGGVFSFGVEIPGVPLPPARIA